MRGTDCWGTRRGETEEFGDSCRSPEKYGRTGVDGGPEDEGGGGSGGERCWRATGQGILCWKLILMRQRSAIPSAAAVHGVRFRHQVSGTVCYARAFWDSLL